MSNRSEGKVLRREEYPEPRTKAGVVALVQRILDPGGVHRIILEHNKPVLAWRFIETDDLAEDEETLDQVLLRSEMLEVLPERGMSGPDQLFLATDALAEEGATPVCWATGREQTGLLLRWLKQFNIRALRTDQILSIPVERLKSLPEDTLILCGARHVNAGLMDVTVSVKLALEIPHEEDLIADADRIGDPPQERGGPVAAAQVGTREHSEPTWSVPSFLRKGR